MTEGERNAARGPVTYPDVRGFLPPSVGRPTGEDGSPWKPFWVSGATPRRIAGVVPPSPYVGPAAFSGLFTAEVLLDSPANLIVLFALGACDLEALKPFKRSPGWDQGLKTVPTAQGGCYLQVDGIPDPRSSLASRCGFGLPPGSRWLLHSRQVSSPAGPLPSQECAN